MTETVELRHANLAAALAAFQAELPQIRKGNTAKVDTKQGPGYAYDYADLADISPVVLRMLGRHGLSWTTSPTLLGDGSGFVLTYQLMHESGESLEGIYPLPPANVAPQAMGSAITYARRYALCAVTGVAPGGDDDDAQAAEAAPRQQAGKKQAPRQKPIAPAQPSRDWVAEANAITSLEALTALAEEADRAGELGLKAGEGRVIDGLKARRDQLEREAAEQAAPMALASDVQIGRQWVEEARALTTWPAVKALLAEAHAAGAPRAAIDAIAAHGESLPDPAADPVPLADPQVDWEPPTGERA